MTKRPLLVTVVIALQLIVGLLLTGLTVYILILTRSPEKLTHPDRIRGLVLGAVVLGVPSLIILIAARGLSRGRFWGWALSLVTDVGMLGMMGYAMWDDGGLDPALVATTAAVFVPTVLILIPSVRKACTVSRGA